MLNTHKTVVKKTHTIVGTIAQGVYPSHGVYLTQDMSSMGTARVK